MRLSQIVIFFGVFLLFMVFATCNNTLYAQKFDREALVNFATQQKQKSKTRINFDKRLPIIYQAASLEAAQSVKSDLVWSGGIAGLNLSGNNQIIGFWDADSPLLTHQEYAGRVSFLDSGPSSTDAHATQMVGIMASTGIVSQAHGMANKSSVEAYNWNEDLAEMALSAADGLTTSAHPYSETAGWTNNSSLCGTGWTWYSVESVNSTKAYQFGYYDSLAHKIDFISYLAPNYLVVKAAGNQRGVGPASQPTKHWKPVGSACVEDLTSVRQLNGGQDGYESINSAAVAKNILVVGGVESSTNNFQDLSTIQPIVGSGFGPTDDGRIKPDIVAPASNIYTATSDSNSAYANAGGTSAATAIVAGSIALIREHYQNLNADTLTSASIRALLAQTADDIGAAGPDYKTGWGLLNTERAVRFISVNHTSAGNVVLKDTTISNSERIQFDFVHTSNQPLIATIAWTDPEGNPPVNGDDPTDIILVNDLDLQISDPTSASHFPWKLDRNNPSAFAIRGVNNVDNIEQVFIENAESGTYTLTISHKNTLQSGSQRVSILVGAAEPEIEFTTQNNGDWSDTNTWAGKTVPSTSQHRVIIKHEINLDTDATVRGITFDGTTSSLDLNNHTLELHGSVQYLSGALGFSGDSTSTLKILDWDDSADSLRFKAGKQELGTLLIDVNSKTMPLSDSLSIFKKLTLQSGVLDINARYLKLISDQNNTAIYQKGIGSLNGEFTYSRLYTHPNSGWRFISSPVENALFSSMNEAFFTQGGEWASHIVSEPSSSLWKFTPENQTYTGYYGADSVFTLGEGYLFYMFEKDLEGKQILPASLEIKGNEPDSVILNLYRGAHDTLSYSLVGNPFAGTLDWHEILTASTNLGTSYAVWSPEIATEGNGTSGFKYYNQADGMGDAGRYIAPMQGFFVQATSEGAQLRFRQNQKVTDTPIKYGKQLTNASPPYLKFELKNSTGAVLDNQARLVFNAEAHSGKDRSDVARISSLNNAENNISFLNEYGIKNVFEGRSSEVETDDIPLVFDVDKSGNYELNWDAFNSFPEAWQLELRDLETGVRLNMNKHKSHNFYHSLESNSSTRFKITVNRGALVDTENELPLSYSLGQNYPNPFNPTTTFYLSIPKNEKVKLSIYNSLGQEVAVLMNETRLKGHHTIEFNAAHLASGVYYYRLQTDGFTETRAMTIIK